MSQKNKDFFKKKKAWSKVKDELLGCYLKPYMQKILYTKKPVIYVDCFAGKGKFEDGNPGSPIIALDIIEECLDNTFSNNRCIFPFFIELNYSNDLCNNLSSYKNINIISGRYEEEILKLLEGKRECNVFLYIDPYGIKALDCNLFDSFAQNANFNSIELLINMNSFGFIREGCRVLNVEFKNEDILDDLVEYDTAQMSSDEKSQNDLCRIAGGDYWIQIINEYKKDVISVYDAEALFAEEYCKRLRQSYRYVLNMPLRIKQGQLPKYRMIHATNHSDGCILMADNICGRWELMRDIQTDGQQMLWSVNANNNEIVDEEEIRKKVVEHLCKIKINTRMNIILADFFTVYGVICPTKMIKKIYKDLEKNGKIVVTRTPPFTEHTRKISIFFADEKGKKTELRWNQ